MFIVAAGSETAKAGTTIPAPEITEAVSITNSNAAIALRENAVTDPLLTSIRTFLASFII
jgi:hypothetical protein